MYMEGGGSNPYPDKLVISYGLNGQKPFDCSMLPVTDGKLHICMRNAGFTDADDGHQFFMVIYPQFTSCQAQIGPALPPWWDIRIDGQWTPEAAGPFRGSVAEFKSPNYIISLSEAGPVEAGVDQWRWSVTAVGRRISPSPKTSVFFLPGS